MCQSLATDPRKWWRLSKRLLNNKSTSIPAMARNGNIIADDHDKAEAFNVYFIECSMLNDSFFLPNNYDMLSQNKIDNLEARVCDVQKCLSQLDVTKAFGPDGVSPKPLKEGTHQLAPALCRLINLSLTKSKFPRTWKLVNVIPLYKKNDRNSITN